MRECMDKARWEGHSLSSSPSSPSVCSNSGRLRRNESDLGDAAICDIGTRGRRARYEFAMEPWLSWTRTLSAGASADRAHCDDRVARRCQVGAALARRGHGQSAKNRTSSVSVAANGECPCTRLMCTREVGQVATLVPHCAVNRAATNSSQDPPVLGCCQQPTNSPASGASRRAGAKLAL